MIDGARRVLVSVTGGPDMTLQEVHEAASLVYEAADPDANIIFSAVIDQRLSDEIRVTIIATGFGEETAKISAPSLGAREKPASTISKPLSASPGAATLAAEFGSQKTGPLAADKISSVQAPESRTAADRADGLEKETAAFGLEKEEADSRFEMSEAAGGPKASLLRSWMEDADEQPADDQPTTSASAPDRRFARAAAEEEGPGAAGPRAEEDVEGNLEIPAIIRRRRSFFS